MISLQRASLRYGDILGLSPTSFELEDGGGITGLLGPNGAGKSSLIQLLSGPRPTAMPRSWPASAWCPRATGSPGASGATAGCG